jgi:hypothetical protein
MNSVCLTILDFLGYCDRRDMAKDYGLQDMDLRTWLEKINMIGENWTKQDIIDEAFMLYQGINETWNDSCELDHISVK